MSGAGCTSRASIGRRPRQARHSSDRNRRRCSSPTSGRERGVLLSAADGQLQARPFDAAALRLVGDPRTLPVAAGANTPYHSAMLSASADLLATVAMPMAYGVRLGTVARDGTAVRMSERQPQNWPRLSPDGKRMARQMVDPVRGNPDIWVEDLHDGSLVRVTTATGSDLLPVWSPDGRRLAYGSGTLKERRLSIAAADGTGVAQELPCPGAYCEPTDWSPDGRSLIVNTRLLAIGAGDVWSVSLEPGGSAKAILSGPFPEYDARISPDGTMARLRVGGDWPTGRLRPRDVGPAEASRGVQRRRQPTRLAPRWAGDSLRRSRRPSSWPVGATPTERRADTRCRQRAERAARRIGTLGHAVQTCRQTGNTCTSSTGRLRRGRATSVS